MEAPVRTTPLVIGRYALYGEIAAGGMATVHYGRLVGPVGFSRTVAIKRLHAQYAKDPEFATMFLDEARLAARIRHPNVVPTLDVVATEDELFVVMDYVQGESLVRLLRASTESVQPVPLDVVSGIVCGALHGLHAAHEASGEDGAPLGIVHRDVSPHNVLVGSDGVPRVLDFGVAKATGRLQTTREGQLKGKLAYMSPEQVRSEPVDRRTDVYAMGVVLWETLTLTRLFRGEVEIATMQNVLEGTRRAPSSVAPHVPKSLDEVALRALDRDPANRFQTAREMAVALEAAVPLASATRIADWVEKLAGDVLVRRARSVAEIESPSGVGRAGAGGALREGSPDEETRADPRRTSGPLPEAGGSSPTSRALSSSLSAAAKVERRRVTTVAVGMVALVSAVAAVAVVSGVVGARGCAWRATDSATVASASASAPSPSPHATTLLDLPPPPTSVPEAAHEFAAGMQTLHDNNWLAAAEHFERASQLDPLMAAAHLRFAMTSAAPTREKSRAAYMRAVDLRGRLTQRDQALMEAIEPVVLRSHGDPVEATRRLEALVAVYPLDVEIYDLLGVVRPDSPTSLAVSERAIALDPNDGQAWQTKGTALWTLGRLDDASEAFARCSALSVDSADCLVSSAVTDRALGRCAEYERDARAYADRNPGHGWSMLAAAMVGMSRPDSAVREEVEQGVLRLEESARARASLAFAGQMALVDGDFDSVRDLGAREAAAIASDPSARADLAPHYRLALRIVSAALERGDTTGAQAIAHEFVARSETWARDPVPAPGGDLSVYLMQLDARGDVGADFEARRRSWIDARLSEGHVPGTLWVPAFAAPALTPDQARAALDAMVDYEPLAQSFDYESIQDAVVGHAYVLAGRPQDALSFLRRAVASCNVLLAPLSHTRAALDLGAALEATGDERGACGAYAKVLARWGKAKPRSITADRARERAKALGCGR